MGRRGPRPTPNKVLEARGSRRTRKAASSTCTPTMPMMPTWLDAEARKVWRRIVPELAAWGTLTAIDANALGRCCVTWVEWTRAAEQVRREGQAVPIMDQAGNIKRWRIHPAVAIMHKSAGMLLRLEQEFSMTPASRARAGLDVDEALERADDEAFDFDAGPIAGRISEPDDGGGQAP